MPSRVFYLSGIPINYSYLVKVIFAMMSVYLLIDSLNGFFVLGLGIDIKLSVFYKSILLVLLMVYLARYSPTSLVTVLSFFFLLMLGESKAIFMLDSSAEKLAFIVQHIVKLITPFVMLCFLYSHSTRDPEIYIRLKKIIDVNCLFFILNIFAGVLGYGYSTYGDEVGATNIGIKGFFYAGNEISALLVLFSGFYMATSYTSSRLKFIFFALLWCVVGALISTKTSILAVICLAFLIPMINDGKRLFALNNIASVVFYLVLIAIFVQSIIIYETFQNTMMYGRLEYFYRNNGILGIILSSRDMFLLDMWEMFYQKASIFTLLFGNGVSYYADSIKYSVELDLPDIFFWHGIVGLLVVLTIFASMTYFSVVNIRDKHYPFAGLVLLTNILLFFIANLSGHIFTSGMLSFMWPCFAIMARYRTQDET
jgi:hypothetical protein